MVGDNALSALLLVFAVAGGLILVLFAVAGSLAFRHARQRNARHRHTGDVGLRERAGLRDSMRTLTTGDLVMDPELADQLETLVKNRKEPDSTT